MSNINFKASPLRAGYSVQTRSSRHSKRNGFNKDLLSFNIGQSTIMVSLMVLSAILGLLYLFTFNSIATKGYKLKSLEVERQELNIQNDLKVLKVAEAKSLNNIITKDRLSVMRTAADPEFITITEFIAKND